jgi:hypothetical protein
MTERLARHLADNPELNLGDVAHVLQSDANNFRIADRSSRATSVTQRLR